jgi:ribosomal-protein-alanine N-acetyltransferase
MVEFPQKNELKTKRLVLRKVDISDALVLYEYWSDKEVTQYMNIAPFENAQQAEEMIVFLNSLADQQKAFRWSIICRSSNRILGTCGFNSWDKENKRAEIGYELGKRYWGQGIMIEALSGIITYGFRAMELNRIQALVEPNNRTSQRILMKMGFQEEGLLRQYEQAKGNFIDLIMYSLLKSNSDNRFDIIEDSLTIQQDCQ